MVPEDLLLLQIDSGRFVVAADPPSRSSLSDHSVSPSLVDHPTFIALVYSLASREPFFRVQKIYLVLLQIKSLSVPSCRKKLKLR